jgi:hypothetical protein
MERSLCEIRVTKTEFRLYITLPLLSLVPAQLLLTPIWLVPQFVAGRR